MHSVACVTIIDGVCRVLVCPHLPLASSWGVIVPSDALSDARGVLADIVLCEKVRKCRSLCYHTSRIVLSSSEARCRDLLQISSFRGPTSGTTQVLCDSEA